MEITKGKIKKAQKVVIYGPEGIGKSTFASKFPSPIFSDTEGSTALLDVARLPNPSSWTMLLMQAQYVKTYPDICSTYIIDTADWAEMLCTEHICAKAQNNGIEDFGYGKGYIYLAEEFGRLLNLLQEVVDIGINVVITAHATMRKIERPEETGAYDHWELKLQKKTAPLLKEWADMVLFANYEIHVVNVDGQGAAKGKNKAQGGKRVMHTAHTPYWDAKNRHGLEDKLDFDFAKIAHCITTVKAQTEKPTQETLLTAVPKEAQEPVKIDVAPAVTETPPVKPVETKLNEQENYLKPLYDLMDEWEVTHQEIQEAVSQKGYYPKATPIANYDMQFVKGVLIGAWKQVHNMVIDNRSEETPF